MTTPPGADTALLSVGPQTNGWDAVLAVNAGLASAILLQEYLAAGPGNRSQTIRYAVQDGSDLVIVDVTCGPTELSFDPAGLPQQCRLQIPLVSGALVRVTTDGTNYSLANAMSVRPDQSQIIGTAPLRGAVGDIGQGGTTVGTVILDLPAGTFQPSIAGVDSNSPLSSELTSTLTAYFAAHQEEVTLGTVVTSAVPASLQPQSFELATMIAPDGGGDGCVVALIQTNGTAGTSGPLPAYPIASGTSASLIVSAGVLAQLIAPAMTQQFSSCGVTFAPEPDSAPPRAVGSGGSIDFGQIGQLVPDQACGPFSSVTQDHEVSMADAAIVPVDMMVGPAGGNLAALWIQQWEQQWSLVTGSVGGPFGLQCDTENAQTLVTWIQLFNGAADPATCIVTFTSEPPNVTLTPAKGSTFDKWWNSHEDLPGSVRTAIEQSLESAFAGLQLPDIDTFALQNLLFPNAQAMALSTVAAPYDLQLGGNVRPPLAVQPVSTTVSPGGSCTFTATYSGPGEIDDSSWTWAVMRPVGRITANGSQATYAPPSQVFASEVVVVTASAAVSMSGSGGAAGPVTMSGSAAVLLLTPTPPGELTLAPSQATVSAGSNVPVWVTDGSGNPVAGAEFDILPAWGGSVTAAAVPGQYTYQAPATILDNDTTVSIIANSSGAQGRAAFALGDPTELSVTTTPGTVGPGGSVTLDAPDSGQGAVVRWVVYPGDEGTVAPVDSSDTAATYTAPADLGEGTQARVIAYQIEDDWAVAVATITLDPTA